MKDIRCMFGIHKFNEWVEAEEHYLKRECQRCGKMEVIYPDPKFMLANWFELSPDIKEVVIKNLARTIDEELNRLSPLNG